MSSAPTGHRGQAPSDPGPGGQPAAAAAGATAPPAAGTGGAGRAGDWRVTAARYAPPVAAAAAMTAAGLWGLARGSAMGNDEVVSRWAALLPLRQLAHLLRHVDAVHGLYYLLLHGWMAAGSSPAVMRIPSVIAMAVAAALIVIIGRRLTGSAWAGLFAGLILALTPSITYYAQTARSYALVFACVLAATLALLGALQAEAPAGAQAAPGGRAAGPGGRITGPGGRITDPGGRIADPGGRIADPGGRIADPGGRAAGPGGRIADPGGRAAGPGGRRARAGGGAAGQVRRRWLAYAALMTLGGYLNEMALLALAAHAVTVLLARYGRPAIRHWAAASATAVVLTGPLIAISIRQRGALGPIARPGWHDLWILYHDYFGTTIPAALLLAACAVVALLPPAGWRGRRGSSAAQAGTDAGAGIAVPGRPAAGAGATAPGGPAAPGRPAKEPGPPAQASRAAGAGMATQAGLAAEADPGPHAGPEPESPWWRSGGMPLPSVALPLLLVPAALLLVESVVAPPVYVDRYVLYGEAGAALLAGAGMYRAGQWLAGAARPRALIWVPGAVVCISALLLQLGPLQRVRTPGVRLYNFGGPAFYIAAHARPGDGVLFFSSFYRKARLGYPAQFRKTSDFALATSPAVARPFRGIDKPFAAVRPLMLGHRRIWVVGLRPSASLPGPMREESMVLQRDFSRIAVQGWRGVWVTLWRRR